MGAEYRARTSENLGSVQLEPVGEGPAALFDDPLALTGLASAAAVAAVALPEREPHPGVFLAFEALSCAFALPEVWPAVYVRFEGGTAGGDGLRPRPVALRGHGCNRRPGLCQPPHRARHQPRGGGALSRPPLAPAALHAGDPGGLGPGDVGAGLAITGRFLERDVFGPLNRPLPPARIWLVDALEKAGRL